MLILTWKDLVRSNMVPISYEYDIKDEDRLFCLVELPDSKLLKHYIEQSKEDPALSALERSIINDGVKTELMHYYKINPKDLLLSSVSSSSLDTVPDFDKYIIEKMILNW